jgi:hypothetical protein
MANLPYLQHNQGNPSTEVREEPEGALTDVLPPVRAAV